MIDAYTEKLVLLGNAAKHPLLMSGRDPGRPINRSVLERWRTRGIGGIVLETIKRGGLRYTSVEAIQRFLDRQNSPGATTDSTTLRQVAKAHVRAKEELAAAGW
jgi:hypothetical protein